MLEHASTPRVVVAMSPAAPQLVRALTAAGTASPAAPAGAPLPPRLSRRASPAAPLLRRQAFSFRRAARQAAPPAASCSGLPRRWAATRRPSAWRARAAEKGCEGRRRHEKGGEGMRLSVRRARAAADETCKGRWKDGDTVGGMACMGREIAERAAEGRLKVAGRAWMGSVKDSAAPGAGVRRARRRGAAARAPASRRSGEVGRGQPWSGEVGRGRARSVWSSLQKD